jgi:asparagine N-glycosylation enzyme membrane subunit Stt3
MSTAAKWLAAFGRFWWEFLVGDTPELFVAVLAVIGIAFALHRSTASAVVVLLVAVVAFLGLSTWRGRKRAGG